MNAAASGEAAGQLDFAFMAFVLIGLAFGVFMAMWALARNSASVGDVAQLSARVGAVEGQMRDVTDKIAHLPTVEHVHGIDLRLERVSTSVEAVVKQTDRIYGHLMERDGPQSGERVNRGENA